MPENSESGRRTSLKDWLPKGLSGKLLLLTIVFVMVAEVLIFVPSVANFRLTWIRQHLQMAEAVVLVFDKIAPESDSREVQNQLLLAADALAIVVREKQSNRILASDSMPISVERQSHIETVDKTRPIESIMDAFNTLFYGGDRAVRVYMDMQHRQGTIEIVMKDDKLRNAMLTYARNVMLISLVISISTALLVFLTLRWFLIRPMQHMTRNMMAFSNNPEAPDGIIQPRGSADEIGVAEIQLAGMQKQLQDTLSQQRKLADLGLAVSKINHDLRNILAAAQLFSDRLTSLPDPSVQRLAPKLIRTLDRAVGYTQAVLSYGKASEAAPDRRLLRAHQLVEEVAELLAVNQSPQLIWVNSVPVDLEIYADAEQMFRVVMNLCRNSLQSMEQIRDETLVQRLEVSGFRRGDNTIISVSDTGPGVPERARGGLFKAFQGSTRPGGTGLGLAIAAEIVRTHGGEITLAEGDEPGARFEISLPAAPQSYLVGNHLKVVG